MYRSIYCLFVSTNIYVIIASQKHKLEEILEDDQRRVENDINDLAKNIETIAGNITDPQSKIDNISLLMKKINIKLAEIEKITEREVLLDIPHTGSL